MTIVEARAITGGVDTHADVHVAAALDPIGGLPGAGEFPATPAGYARLAVSTPTGPTVLLLCGPAFSGAGVGVLL